MKSAYLDFKKMSSLALSQSRSLVPALLKEGKQIGREWIARNPRRNDQTLGSFKINLDSGRWADFATGDKGGDLISLVAYLDDSSQLEAANKILTIIGVSR